MGSVVCICGVLCEVGIVTILLIVALDHMDQVVQSNIRIGWRNTVSNQEPHK